jgi:hypothetical protein
MYNNKHHGARQTNSYWEIMPTKEDYPKVHLLIYTSKVWLRFCVARTYGQ